MKKSIFTITALLALSFGAHAQNPLIALQIQGPEIMTPYQLRGINDFEAQQRENDYRHEQRLRDLQQYQQQQDIIDALKKYDDFMNGR
jgi:hypothetical protein